MSEHLVNDSTTTPTTDPLPDHRVKTPSPPRKILPHVLSALSPSKVSALYVAGFAMIVFAFWIPDLFYTETTFKSLLYQQAITALVALAFLIPYTTHNFDLTVGATVGVSSLVCAWLMTSGSVPWPAAIVIALAFCSLIGVLNAFLITVIRIESVIATIATMSMIEAVGSAAFNGQQIFGLPQSFLALSQNEIFGVSVVFYYLIIIAVALWYVLRHTPLGRYLYAIGGNTEAARLAGLQVRRLIFLTFVASALLAGIAGVLVSSRVGTGDFAIGPHYLFPAAAAMFFGSTQVKPGTYNVWGTLLAVYTLAIVVKGLELGGAPFWVTEVANGVALLIAVGFQSVRVARSGMPTSGSWMHRLTQVVAPSRRH